MSASSSSAFAVEAIEDLLEGEPASSWTNTTPTIEKVWETTQQERENVNSPHLFIWSPLDSSFTRFSSDGSHLEQTDTVEVWIITLDPTETARYGEDVIDILSSYMGDNESSTGFIDIQPVSAADNRHEHITRRTDHYAEAIQVELDGFRPTGVS